MNFVHRDHKSFDLGGRKDNLCVGQRIAQIPYSLGERVTLLNCQDAIGDLNACSVDASQRRRKPVLIWLLDRDT